MTEDLMRTLAVEATIHDLDLDSALPDAAGPARQGPAETRRALDGPLVHRVSIETWDT